MPPRDTEIERIARELIAQHGKRAARVAIERLNELIDGNNVRGRDIWACIVHEIHEIQGTGPVFSGAAREGWEGGIASLDCAAAGGPAL